MLCKSVTETMNNTGPGGAINFNHVNETFCASSLKYQWFNSTEMITLRNVLFAHQVEETFIYLLFKIALICRSAYFQ